MITEAEFVDLFQRKYPNVLRIVASKVRGLDRDDYDDAVMVAFERLWRYRASVDEGFSWVATVARREAYLILLHRTAQDELLEGQSNLSVETEAEYRELLDRALHLRKGRATALVGRMLGFSYEELAARTGQSYTWVNRHTTEGRAELRDAA